MDSASGVVAGGRGPARSIISRTRAPWRLWPPPPATQVWMRATSASSAPATSSLSARSACWSASEPGASSTSTCDTSLQGGGGGV